MLSPSRPNGGFRRVAALALVPLVGGAALVAAAPAAQAVDVASPVVISEVYGGGGNTGAVYTNDFVELYNKGTTAVDVSTWSVQYASASGVGYAKTDLAGSIPAQSYYLVQEAAGAGGTTSLPAPDAVGTIAMGATAGKVALVSNQTALTCGADCDSSAGVVDFVGFGTAADFAGAPAPATSNTTSVQRDSTAADSGSNAVDFTVAAPTPKAAPGETPPPPNPCATTPLPPQCVAGTTTIQDIQGSGFLSPLAGSTVERVAGIVTAIRPSGSSGGFWIQQPTADPARPSASTGVYVFTRTAPTVAVGDSVLVTGAVSEYYAFDTGTNTATTDHLSITEVTATMVTTVSTGNALPAAVPLAPDTVPELYAPTPAGGNVESISPVDPAHSALEFWEAHEGMLVAVQDARVVGPGQTQFDEIYVTTKPAQLRTPRGGTYAPGYAELPSGRVLVTPLTGSVPAANVGDVLTGATAGPVDWSKFGGYTIAATRLGGYQDNGLTPTAATAQADNQLAIATYNVENLAPADPPTKYDRLATGIVTNLAAPDVIAVEEIQDNSGAANDGVVDADATLGKLTNAITDAGGPAYAWIQINPVDGRDGGQPGGNIRSVFLYNPGRVTLAPGTVGGSLDAVAVSTGVDGTAKLSLNPGRVDPTNAAWTSSRKPLAAQFVFQGRTVVVVANHFNSKGGDQSADGRFQPPNRASEVQRRQQATVLNGFVKAVLAADPNANVVLAGDFNDYQFSGPIQALTDNGATLTDLITTLPADQRYTYVFNGVSQVLDHIFVTKPVTDVQYEVVHTNSEFAGQVSDHDPQVVRIRPTVRQGTLTLDPSSVSAGSSTTVRLVGWYPNRELSVALDTQTAGTVTTDGTGAASFTLPVPAATTAGPHTVTASSPSSGSASAVLTIRPPPTTTGSVTVLPPLVVRGWYTLVYLDGWSPGAQVTLTIDGIVRIGTVQTGPGGRGLTAARIPSTTLPGTHTVVATTSDGGGASATIRVF